MSIKERGFVLLNSAGSPAEPGELAQNFRGETVIIERGACPRHPGSEGRVQVTLNGQSREFYPSVIGAQWVRETDWKAGIYAPKVSDYQPGAYI